MNATAPTQTVFELLGGDGELRRLVDQFYSLMDSVPDYAPLRAIHATDLNPMREKLADWMSGWLGGPALYDSRPDATCIGHAHAAFKIDATMRDQWVDCMNRALDECDVSADVQTRLRPPLAALAEFLRNH
jgi:hemoglobin